MERVGEVPEHLVVLVERAIEALLVDACIADEPVRLPVRRVVDPELAVPLNGQ